MHKLAVLEIQTPNLLMETADGVIAGDNNDEAGVQQGIKVRDSRVHHSESSEDENKQRNKVYRAHRTPLGKRPGGT